MSLNILIPLIIALASGLTALVLAILFLRKLGSLAVTIQKWWQRGWQRRPWPVFTTTTITNWERTWRQAGWRWGIPDRRFCFISSLGLVTIFSWGGWELLAGGGAVIAGSLLILYQRTRRWRRTIVAALPEVLRSLANALQAGYSIPQAVQFLARATTHPWQNIFTALSRVDYYRLPLPVALTHLSAILNIPEWSLTTATLIAAIPSGGNLVPLLTTQAETWRDQAAAAAEIKSLTAAGRWSGWLVALLVPAAFLLFLFLQPSYLYVFFTTTLGRSLFIVAALLEGLGLVWISRLVRLVY